MPATKGYKAAWLAHDIALEELTKLRTPTTNPFKAIAVAKLVLALDRIQARIRIHRGKPRKRKPVARQASRPAKAPVVISCRPSKKADPPPHTPPPDRGPAPES